MTYHFEHEFVNADFVVVIFHLSVVALLLAKRVVAVFTAKRAVDRAGTIFIAV